MNKVRLTAWLLLAVSITQTQPCWSLTLGKRQNAMSSFIAQPNEKLEEDAGLDAEVSESKPASTDLTPLSLNGDKSATSEGDEHYLKSTVTENEFVPKVQDATTKSTGLNSLASGHGKGEKRGLFRKAQEVNVMPVPLMESPEETADKIDKAQTAEQTQLSDLWEAALARSQDIQFVIQKLMPNSDEGHAANVITKMLSTAVYGAMGAANMMMPNAGMQLGSSMGASMMMNALGAVEGDKAKKARLSQTEAIMLYNMVRHTADDLVKSYRDYKKTMVTLSRSLVDLQDLQAMIGEASAGQDSAKQIEMQYTLRKAQRDVDVVANDVKHYRQSLIDLSGAEAVDKLDKQLDEEQKSIEIATPVGDAQKVM